MILNLVWVFVNLKSFKENKRNIESWKYMGEKELWKQGSEQKNKEMQQIFRFVLQNVTKRSYGFFSKQNTHLKSVFGSKKSKRNTESWKLLKQGKEYKHRYESDSFWEWNNNIRDLMWVFHKTKKILKICLSKWKN